MILDMSLLAFIAYHYKEVTADHTGDDDHGSNSVEEYQAGEEEITSKKSKHWEFQEKISD